MPAKHVVKWDAPFNDFARRPKAKRDVQGQEDLSIKGDTPTAASLKRLRHAGRRHRVALLESEPLNSTSGTIEGRVPLYDWWARLSEGALRFAVAKNN